MPAAHGEQAKIKVIQKERIKGPLSKVSGTASLANRVNFFFNLPQPSEPNLTTTQAPPRKE